MKKKILVYSTPTCPWCNKAKEFLKKNKVEFKEVDVSTDEKGAKDMMDKSGQMGVPVIDIDGEIIVGFDEKKIKVALES
ncbi:NrdH-redoxin [archaeon]|nr:NrdH-redoxin [archaeon]